MQVTVTGGVGHNPAILQYYAANVAEKTAAALAATIDSTYSHAIYYNPSHPPTVPSPGYLIVRAGVASNTIDARGFGAIVDENTQEGSTIRGGGNASGQTVLASNGGLTFSAISGATTVVAGGGPNDISFAGDTSAVAAYTSGGRDTIIGGDGATTISAGGGANKITLGMGASMVRVTGTDNITLGTGSDTIDVLGGSARVIGGMSVAGGGFSLTFNGGNGPYASTVMGGAGSFDIVGGAGGGSFHGGSGGNNLIVGGTGSVTITGGGAGDTLRGGSNADFIRAGLGNETLTGAGGADTFILQIHSVTGASGAGTVDIITDFNSQDLLALGGPGPDTYALNTYKMTATGGTFFLEDGTKVVLKGFHQALTSADFKH